MTPLMLATREMKEESTKYLLEMGADPNNVGEYVESPLAMAVDWSNRMVRLLLKYGAKAHEEKTWGDSALQVRVRVYFHEKRP